MQRARVTTTVSGSSSVVGGSGIRVIVLLVVVLAIVLAAGLVAVRARGRSTSAPAQRRTDRLRAALATGRMGEWSWDMTSGTVIWDHTLESLFGCGDGEFAGTFDAWMEKIDPRDRSRVRKVIEDAVAQPSTFRFDHRGVWPDGSVHWIEGIGEIVVDGGQVVGAFGLAIDVDERHLQIEERNRLVDSAQRESRRAEFLASVHDVLALSVDIDEIVGRVTATVIPGLADWCSIVVSADRPADHPLIRVAHQDPAKVKWAQRVQRDFPYDPQARWGAANVIRTGHRESVEQVDQRLFDLPGGEVLRAAGVGSLITVPLVGAVGTLGALQLIRGPDVAAFTPDELEFVDELAARVGAALNTAVLFERQGRSRAALDTLQQVSGRIAAAATPAEVMRASLGHAARGVGARSGALYLASPDDELILRETVGVAQSRDSAVELSMARATVTEATLTTRQERDLGTVIGVPLQILNRTTGAIVLVVGDDRLLADDELSMLITLGSRCAGAMERSSLYERERSVALTLQHRLLSVLPDTPAWLDAAARYVPATSLEIGGDWFQLLDAGRGRIAAIVGDAIGHGIASAAAMGQLRASIATAVANDPLPSRTLTAADLFARRGADTVGASAASLLLDPDGHGRYACAGLPPPLLVRPGQPARLLSDGRRPLLGVGEPAATYPDGTFDFNEGDFVVMYTDGLVERRNELIDIGFERLLSFVEANRDLPPEELCDSVLAAGLVEEPEDDIALLILRRRAT